MFPCIRELYTAKSLDLGFPKCCSDHGGAYIGSSWQVDYLTVRAKEIEMAKPVIAHPEYVYLQHRDIRNFLFPTAFRNYIVDTAQRTHDLRAICEWYDTSFTFT